MISGEFIGDDNIPRWRIVFEGFEGFLSQTSVDPQTPIMKRQPVSGLEQNWQKDQATKSKDGISKKMGAFEYYWCRDRHLWAFLVSLSYDFP